MRGEITIMLANTAYRLCPTFAALMAMEEQTGCGLITLAKRFAEGSFTLMDVKAVCEAGIKGAGQTPPADLGATLIETGVVTIAPLLTAFLAEALSGGKDTAVSSSQGKA